MKLMICFLILYFKTQTLKLRFIFDRLITLREDVASYPGNVLVYVGVDSRYVPQTARVMTETDNTDRFEYPYVLIH